MGNRRDRKATKGSCPADCWHRLAVLTCPWPHTWRASSFSCCWRIFSVSCFCFSSCVFGSFLNVPKGTFCFCSEASQLWKERLVAKQGSNRAETCCPAPTTELSMYKNGMCHRTRLLFLLWNTPCAAATDVRLWKQWPQGIPKSGGKSGRHGECPS